MYLFVFHLFHSTKVICLSIVLSLYIYSAVSLSLPAALSERPFYEEWWFLLVMALVGLILILVLVFTLLLHGNNTKYKACGTGLCLGFQIFDTLMMSQLCHRCVFFSLFIEDSLFFVFSHFGIIPLTFNRLPSYIL